MGLVAIERGMLGRMFDDSRIKTGLRRLHPGFHFDMGVCLGIWHPYRASRQGVFYEGRHICSMDRGMVPEMPLWTTKRQLVRLPACELSWSEIEDQFTVQECIYDAKGNAIPTGIYSVRRQVRDRLLFVGWRHTFSKVSRFGVPGVDRKSLELEFGVDLIPRLEESPEVPEEIEAKILLPSEIQ